MPTKKISRRPVRSVRGSADTADSKSVRSRIVKNQVATRKYGGNLDYDFGLPKKMVNKSVALNEATKAATTRKKTVSSTPDKISNSAAYKKRAEGQRLIDSYDRGGANYNPRPSQNNVARTKEEQARKLAMAAGQKMRSSAGKQIPGFNRARDGGSDGTDWGTQSYTTRKPSKATTKRIAAKQKYR